MNRFRSFGLALALFGVSALVTATAVKAWPGCALRDPVNCSIKKGQGSRCWSCCQSQCDSPGNCSTKSCQDCEACCVTNSGC